MLRAHDISFGITPKEHARRMDKGKIQKACREKH